MRAEQGLGQAVADKSVGSEYRLRPGAFEFLLGIFVVALAAINKLGFSSRADNVT